MSAIIGAKKTWSVEEDKKLLRAWLVQRHSQNDIADELEKGQSSVSRRIKDLDLRGEKGNFELYEQLTGERVESLLKPVEVNIVERSVDPPSSVDVRSFHWSDVHFPFQDDRAVEVIRQIVADLAPNELHAQGDFLDFWQISSHRPKRERTLNPDQIDLQPSLDMAAEHLGEIVSLSSAKEEDRYFYGGNHEQRLERLLAGAEDDRKWRHLLHLRKIQNVLSVPTLLGLDSIGFGYIPYMQDPMEMPLLRDRLLPVHGNKAVKYTAEKMLDRYGTSVIYGHDHRIQTHTKRTRRGQEAAFGIGCLCNLTQDYGKFFNWHQGAAVVDWKETSDGWIYHVDQIRVHGGRTVFRGKSYSA